MTHYRSPDWPASPLLNQIICGDALDVLEAMPDQSVNTIITSPPYYGLRDYGVDGQIGLEKTPADYVQTLMTLFREARRVLRNDGVLWLNLGDTYTGGGRGDTPPLNTSSWKKGTNNGSLINKRTDIQGLQSKNLLLIPARVAIALQDDGWICRMDVIWHKPNPMPESVTDRPTKAHEYVFMFVKSGKYFYDAEAIKEPAVSSDPKHEHYRANGKSDSRIKHIGISDIKPAFGNEGMKIFTDRNKRSVWTVPTTGFPGAHFATFPPALIEPMILAGCPKNGIVYDPFMGSGTTALVARALGRQYIGSEINLEYVAMANERLRLPFEKHSIQQERILTDLPMFAAQAVSS